MGDFEQQWWWILNRTKNSLETLQSMLNFDGWEKHPHYRDRNGLGRSGLIGCLLGVVGGFHACLFLCLLCFVPQGIWRSVLLIWSLHVVFLATFHFLEFFVTSVRQPHSLSTDSFVVNHSLNYTIAIIASCLEFWLEVIVFGHKRLQYKITFILGLIMVIGGQYFRSLAMWQCGESFNHIIAHIKPGHHRLQTEGLYKYLRHPSYFGWFYWSIGMQLILGNFWCFCAYFYVSWKFFHDRIPYEEHTLWLFYGRDYQEYVQRSHIGIPFIFSNIPRPTQNVPKAPEISTSAVNDASREQAQVSNNGTSDNASILEEDDEDYESAKFMDPQESTTINSTNTISCSSSTAVDEIHGSRNSSRSNSTDKKHD